MMYNTAESKKRSGFTMLDSYKTLIPSFKSNNAHPIEQSGFNKLLCQICNNLVCSVNSQDRDNLITNIDRKNQNVTDTADNGS